MTAPIVERLVALKPDSRPLTAEHKARCPAHEDRVESLSWTVSDDGKVLVKCHAGCATEEIVGALGAEMKDLFESKSKAEPRVASTDEHHVRDVDGNVVAIHLRPHLSDGTKGQMTWKRPDGKPGLNGTPQSALPLYGSHLDLKSSVVLVEGEKCAEALWEAGVAALATYGASHKPEPAVLELLRGRTVTLWPDNDQPGRKHMMDMAKRLAGIAAEVRWLEPPADAPKGWDVADLLALADDKRQAIRDMKERIGPVPGVATLDQYLGRVRDYLDKYIVFQTKYEAVVIALWVAHAHMVERFDTSPILAVVSAEKRSGKTRIFDCLEHLCPTPERMVTPSPAVAYSLMAQRPRPTMMLDEADTIFNKKRKGDNYEDLRAVLNAGNRQGTTVPRVLIDGKKRTIERLDVFGAKAIAGIGELPDTVTDRSIVIRMERRAPHEQVAKFRTAKAKAEAQAISEPDWDAVTLPDEVELPEHLNDRAADSWEPLFQVAAAACDTCDAATGPQPTTDWLSLVGSASGLLTEDEVTTVTVGVRLLTDIREVFGDDFFLPTTELLERLYELDDAPWAEWYGSRISGRGLAQLLKPYRIEPGHTRDSRGYQRRDFENAWSRYCVSPATAVTSVTPVTGMAQATAQGTAIVEVEQDYPASAWSFDA